MSDGIEVKVKAGLDTADSEQHLAAFVRKFNEAGKIVAAANKVKFNPIDPKAVDQVKQLQRNFETYVRVQGDFRSRLKATGQSGSQLPDLNFDAMYPNRHARAAKMLEAYTHVAGGSFGMPPLRPASGQPRRPPGPLNRVMNAGLAAAGGPGRAVAGAVAEGSSFGFMAGLGGLAGGLAALAVGKVIGGIMEKVGAAGHEAIGYDTLKRTLGDTNVSYRGLRAGLRNQAYAQGLTFEESQKLGLQFSRESGEGGTAGARNLPGEIGHSAGFARAFGLDPSQSNSFFAGQRLFGNTRNAEDSKRMGLMIGEGIARAGVFTKVDEVLEAIGSYTAQQTRMGMSSANVAGYASFLTGAMQSGIPGTDPASAAQLLGHVNSAIASGGSAGEAGQNFMYRALGRPLGLNPYQVQIMREQGAFGTGASTFGRGSLYQRFAGGTPSGQAGSSERTNLSLVLERLEKVYGKSPDMMANATSRLFGMTMSQAMALITINREHGSKTLGGLNSRLSRLGIDMNSVNDTATLRMGQIEASPNMTEPQKDAEMRRAAAEGQVSTQGKETRDAITGLGNTMQEVASKLLDPLNAIRSATMYMAGGGKRSSRQIAEDMVRIDSADRVDMINDRTMPGISELRQKLATANIQADRRGYLVGKPKETDAQRTERVAKAEEEAAAVRERLTEAEKQRSVLLEQENDRVRTELGALRGAPQAGGQASTGSVGGSWGPQSRRSGGSAADPGDAFWQAVSAEGSMSPQEIAFARALYQQESGSGANTSTSKKGAVGQMQMLPATFAGVADPGWNINDKSQNLRAGIRYAREAWHASGGDPRLAAAYYYAGPKGMRGGKLRDYGVAGSPGDPSTSQYADQVATRYDAALDAPMPEDPARDAAREAARFERQRVEIGGTFQLIDRNGRQAAAPVTVRTDVTKPTVAGAGVDRGSW